MQIIHALILGIVEGVTEFLPISSTGHLILTSRLMAIAESDFLKSFEIAIQLGAITSVVLVYWRRFFLDGETLKRVIAAFIPSAAIGVLLYTFVKEVLLGSETVVLWSLFVGGIALVIFEVTNKKRTSSESKHDLRSLSYRDAIIIGCCQALAIIPGVSRSAATIVGGMALGLSRAAIVEFSFLLAVPTMAAATGLDLLKSGYAFSSHEWSLLGVGFITAFLVALGSIFFLIRFVKHHTFTMFGVYRIALALIFWSFIL